MPVIAYDSRSFAIDGRRVWLVSGSIHYAGTPAGSWRARLRAAREAGLNCVEVPIVWRLHEPAKDAFIFDGDLDLRAFIRAASEEGLYCILRAGPYIGGEYDHGGLPDYLHGLEDKKGNRIKLREDEPQYLEAVDRFYRAVLEQVGDLQVASNGPTSSPAHSYRPGSAAGGYQGEGGGPIILMQVEHAWECHAPEQLYLKRLVSMLRQHGCTVPLINANNLWQPIDGTIDTWRGDTALPAMMRQLAVVQPDAPTIVSHLDPHISDADSLAYRLAGLIGTGAQFNLSAFDEGNMPRPLDESHQAIKRICTFASQFGSILAHIDSSALPTVALNETAHPTAVLHQQSGQGELIVLLKSAKDTSTHTELMLGNGLTLDVPHANQRCAWVLANTNLGGRTTLDYTSLSPWALIDRQLLVVFGPGGAEGSVSIDGQHLTISVPKGKTPLVIDADPIKIAVLNQEQIDAAYRHSGGVTIGCSGLDEDGNPKPLTNWGTQITISPDGSLQKKRVVYPPRPSATRLTHWQALSVQTLVDGTDPSFRPIDGPTSLNELSQSPGYGWYKFTQPKAAAGKVLPPSSGRLHFYHQKKLTAILGAGEGAEHSMKNLKLGGESIVFADAHAGSRNPQSVAICPTGLPDNLYNVKPIKLGKPSISKQPASDPFAVTGYAYRQQSSARPMSEALAWSIKPESRKPIILEIDGFDQPCVISVNDEPFAYYAGADIDGCARLLMDPATIEAMTGGKNEFKLELLEPLDQAINTDKHIRFYQTISLATPKDGWAFAPWTIPSADQSDWRDMPKALPSQPSWMKGTFDVETLDAPLYFEPVGLTKGRIYLNGNELGRYWEQTREGKRISDQSRIYLPEGWLKLDEPNTLMLFDEHGRTPNKCHLVYSDR